MRRDEIDDRTLEGVAGSLDGQVLDVDRLDPAGELAWQPLDHSRIVAGPCVLEQILLEETVFGIEDQDLRPRLELLEIVRDQGSALIGTGRATERVRRGGDEEDAAILHAFELPSQQLGLWPAIPGVGHDLRGRLVVTLDGAEFEGDARGKHQPVVGQLGAVGETDRLRYRIDGRRGIVDDIDRVALRQRLIAMCERFERAHAGEIEGAEEAGRIARLGLDQRHLDRCSARRQIPRHRRTADAATDDNDPRLRFASRHARGKCREARRSRKAAELASCPAIHGCSDPFFRVAR